MLIKSIICSLALVFLYIVPINAQLSFQTDSLKLLTISDYPKEVASVKSGHPIIEDGGIGYENIIADGPYVCIFGRLINNEMDDCIIDISIRNISFEHLPLLGMYYCVKYTHKGVQYCSNIRSLSAFDYPYSTLIFKEQMLGNTELLTTAIKANSTLPIVLCIPFLKNSKWDRIKRNSPLYENLSHNIKVGRKLENIAIEAYKSIQLYSFISSDEYTYKRIIIEDKTGLQQ